MDAISPSYAYADTPFATELARLQLLEARYDAVTARRLRMFGSLVGARCLEVGAGAGSVTRMLAAEVGPTGSVVATDTDPRFLAGFDEPNVEVRRHDIVTEELEDSAYDLVHCRALLLHLPDPEAALTRMAKALRPGGALLVEDTDFTSFGAADPSHPRSANFDELARSMRSLPQRSRRYDPFLGRRLAALVDGLGLAEREDEALEFSRSGGSPEAQFLARSIEQTRPEIARAGHATAAELYDVLAALADPSFSFVDSLNVASWGRRPVPDFLG